MSKIIKFNSVIVDKENKFNIDIPVFENVTFDEKETDGLREFNEVTESDEINADEIDSEKNKPEDIIESANIKADEIISNARAEAESIINEAKKKALREAENIKDTARNEGYNDGKRQAAVETDAKRREAESLLADAKNQKEEMIRNAEPELIEFTYKVICKVLNDSKIINKDVINCIIKKGLSQTKTTGDIFIHISADDFDTVINNKADIDANTEGSSNVEIIRDLTMNSGDCLIETPFGNIDCGIDQQLKEVKNNLYYILENG